MQKIKVMTVFGTRPEAIKMAPVILELEKQNAQFESIVAVTGQHREMLGQVLELFHIVPDYDLSIMEENQTLSQITSKVMMGIDAIIKEVQPDIVLVHGDTTTAFAASVAAFYNQVKIGHIEAGLRTWNKHSPFPEEVNRQSIDVFSDLYFAPTIQSYQNLIDEKRPKQQIYITGNTAIDALKQTITEQYEHPVFQKIKEGNRIILVTMHRRENQGEPMKRVFQAIKQIVERYPDVEVIFPIHLNPAVRKLAYDILDHHERIHLLNPLEVTDFHNLTARSYMIVSDSGGIQEEAPSLGIPVLVLRETTERPEGIEAGTLKLIGTQTETVLKEMTTLIEDDSAYAEMAQASNPYGDGHAAERILTALLYEYGLTKKRPMDFSPDGHSHEL